MTDSPNNPGEQLPEGSPLTDHTYDGIAEYDNPLPGWWKAMFWGSIAFSALYWAWFEMGPGTTVIEQYEASVARADEEAAARLRARFADLELKPDAATLMALMGNEETMQAQAKVWQAKCAVCHYSDGRGVVGPNMTDDAYLNVRTLADFPRIVAEGVIEKGMTPFRGQLSEEEIIQIAAYAAWLRGREPDLSSGPPAKDAQGETLAPWAELAQ